MADVTLMSEEREQTVVHEVVPIEGLCRDCLQAEHCTFPRDPSRPIWSCDEFEGPELASSYPQRRALPRPTEQAPEAKGLCRGCANWPTCNYPKPVGGVWHCDEMV